MRYLVTAEEMRRYDRFTSEGLGVPDIVLMERAASGAIFVLTEEIHDMHDPSILVICGYGNNGGDGLALARMLHQRHYRVDAVLVGNPDKASSLNELEAGIAANYGLRIRRVSTSEIPELSDELRTGRLKPSVIVDAVFGVGLSRPLADPYDGLVGAISYSGSYVASLDVPSGVNADGTGPRQPSVNADITITFGFWKLAHVLYPGAESCGRVVCADMGIDEFSICGQAPVYRCLTDLNDVNLPARRTFSNKGTYGRLLIIAGSRDIYGAAYMAARAAFETGTGMIKIITHANNRQALQTTLPEAMHWFYDETTSEDELRQAVLDGMDWCDGILTGPGLGLDENARMLTETVILNGDKPVLIDADALKICADDPGISEALIDGRRRGVIMTPHLGELSYMSGEPIGRIRENLTIFPQEFADRMHVTLIAKDARSIIASAGCGDRIYVNLSGNNGMATAGSGDVLSGICAGLMVQDAEDADLFETAVTAAYLHGLCGDAAAAGHGVRGMTATDLIAEIRGVLERVERKNERMKE